MKTLTQERLKQVVSYDPATGLFSRDAKAGESGYVRLSIDGSDYLAHRLAWLYMTGSWPKGQIDHKNGTRSDNRWDNLRDVTTRVNSQNQRKPMNTNVNTGLLGSYRNGDRFMSKIKVNGRIVYLGTFDTPEQAHEIYVAAKRQLHEGCTL